jgi:hypothetical protein
MPEFHEFQPIGGDSGNGGPASRVVAPHPAITMPTPVSIHASHRVRTEYLPDRPSHHLTRFLHQLAGKPPNGDSPSGRGLATA